MDIQIRPNRVRRMVEDQIAENHSNANDTHDRLLKLFMLSPSVAVILGVGVATGIYAGSLGSTTGESLIFGAFTFLLSVAVAGIPLGFSVSESRIARHAWAGLTAVIAVLCIASSFGVGLSDNQPAAPQMASTEADTGPVEWEQPIGYVPPARHTARVEEPSDFVDDEADDDGPREPYVRYVKNVQRWFAAAEEKKRGISRQTRNCREIHNELEDQLCRNFYRLAKQLADAKADQERARAHRIDAVEHIEVVHALQAEPSFGHKAFGALIKVSALLLACFGLAYYTDAKHGLSSGQHGRKPEPNPAQTLDLEPDREAMATAEFNAWADASLSFEPSSVLATRVAYGSYEASVRGNGGKPMKAATFGDELARRVYELGGSRNITTSSSFDGVSLVGATGTMGGNTQAFGSSDFGFGKGF